MGIETRIFNCRRCNTRVFIYKHRDRGNVYCSINCSRMARQKSLRMAGKKYQTTRKGQFKHAERQKRYRERQKQAQNGDASCFKH